jgi:hypothetical protein
MFVHSEQLDTQVGTDDTELFHLLLPVENAEVVLHELTLHGLCLPQRAGVLVQEVLETPDKEIIQLPICTTDVTTSM